MNFKDQKINIWIWVALGITLFLGLGMLYGGNKPIQYPNYVAASPSPTGVKAFYTFLRNEYHHVQVWKKPVTSLPTIENNQLMITIKPNEQFQEGETNKWMKWLNTGNKLLLISDNPNGYFNIDTSPIKDTNQNEVFIFSTSDNKSYRATVNSNVRITPKSEDNILLRDNIGIIALSRPFEKGKLIVLLTPEWVSNGEILKQNNLELLLPLIQNEAPSVIWFNDYIHGYKTVFTLFEVYPKWFLFLFFQAIITLLLWVWYKGKRFGPIELPREWTVRYGDERIRAIAAWYLRGKFYKESLDIQIEYLQHLVMEKWGIPSHSDRISWISEVTPRLVNDKRKQWKQYWQELMVLTQREKIAYKDFLLWSKRLDEMYKEVEKK